MSDTQIRKIKTVVYSGQDHIFIKLKDRRYTPHITKINAKLGVVSPSMYWVFGQNVLHNAFETGTL